MSVLRQLNVLGQQRLDVPHIRSIESSIAADFDVVAGRVQGGGKALVVRGFTLANFSAGTPAVGIQLSTADGIVYNMNASEAGTFLWVPADRAVEVLNSATNARVSGGFTAGQTNYIGIDLQRTADDSTSDLVQFLDPNTLLEQAKTVPLARTLDYRIVISTTPFSANSNIIPVAKVKTDNQNQIDAAAGSVEDARSLMWRLGSGGDFPSQYGAFTWPQNRLEYDPNVSGLSSLERFSGGDKGLKSQKDWMDAVMMRLWEVGGGQNWYSPTADRNLRMTKNPSPVFASTGDNLEFIAGLYSVSHLHWQGLKIVFENSNIAGVYYNTIANQTSDDATGSAATSKTALAIGDCLYVDLDRTSNATVTARKANIQALGTPTIPGSRIIIAWRDANGSVYTRDNSFNVNVAFSAATTTTLGAVKLSYAAGTPTAPVVAPLDANNAISITSTTGTAIFAQSLAGSFAAINAQAAGNGSGILSQGSGSGNGISAVGGSSGRGGDFTGGGAAVGVRGTAGNSGAEGGSFFGTQSFSGVLGTGSSTATGAGVQGIGGNVGHSGFATRERGAGGRFQGGNGSQGLGLAASWGIDARGGTAIAANQNAGGGGVFQAGTPNGSGKGESAVLAMADGATLTNAWTQQGIPAITAVARNITLDLSISLFNLPHGILALGAGSGAGIAALGSGSTLPTFSGSGAPGGVFVGATAGSGGDGIYAIGAGANRTGVYGEGAANGTGGWFQAGAGIGIGVRGFGTGSGAGVVGVGGPTAVSSWATLENGTGGLFTAGSATGNGVVSKAAGSGLGTRVGSVVSTGLIGIGTGVGHGVFGLSAANSGSSGGFFEGSDGFNTHGITGIAKGTGAGGVFFGGAGGGAGVQISGGAGNVAISAVGGSASPGAIIVGGSGGGGNGVEATGTGIHTGVVGFGGPTNGAGGDFRAGGTSGIAVQASCGISGTAYYSQQTSSQDLVYIRNQGSGGAIRGENTGTGYGVYGYSASASQSGGFFWNNGGGPGLEVNQGDLKMSGIQPLSNTPFSNELTKANITKVWGKVQSAGVGTLTVNVVNGFNIASATVIDDTITTPYIQVTFANNFANTDICVVGVASSGGVKVFYVQAAGVNFFRFRTYDLAGAEINAKTNIITCTFTVHGQQ